MSTTRRVRRGMPIRGNWIRTLDLVRAESFRRSWEEGGHQAGRNYAGPGECAFDSPNRQASDPVKVDSTRQQQSSEIDCEGSGDVQQNQTLLLVDRTACRIACPLWYHQFRYSKTPTAVVGTGQHCARAYAFLFCRDAAK